MSQRDADSETYPCFVQVTDDESLGNVIELPTETDGTILLSTVQAQYPSAIGLKYKSASGSWRGVRLSDNVLDPPFGGWQSNVFHITLSKSDSVKRKMEESPNREPEAKLVKTGSESDLLSDLIVLGLPYKATEHDVKEYFQQFGELDLHEIKYDPVTKESRGFGFIRFKEEASAQRALKCDHKILGRRCEVKMPKEKDDMPLKLFIGRLPDGTKQDDLSKLFGEYGDLTDVYIPNPFRGFGFVTFTSSDVARQVLHGTHTFKGSRLNVTHATPKGEVKSSRNYRQSRSQDRPFDFQDMRQVMYNNPQQTPGYNSYPSNNSSKNSYDTRNNVSYPFTAQPPVQQPMASYPTTGNSSNSMPYQQPPSAANVPSMQAMQQSLQSMQQAMQNMQQYGAYWSKSK